MSISNVRPLGDRVLVRRNSPVEKTKGGIIIPENVAEKPIDGEVVKAGPGRKTQDGTLVAMDVQDGDQIIFTKWAGTEVCVNGEQLLVMKESDIIGVTFL